MGDGSYEPPSLQPLLITPAMVARARANDERNGVMHQHASHAAPASADQVEQLKSMFPDFDSDVLSSVLATCGGNMESAVSQLLEMNGGPASSTPQESELDMDEELAAALFQSFAEDLESSLGTSIPADIKADPEKFEAFVRQHLETALKDTSSPMAAQANHLFKATGASEAFVSRGGKDGFLDRIKGMTLLKGGRGMNMVKVDNSAAKKSLLDNDGGD
ncbi:hypothetical protein AB1Y20_006599 [Prymnesium parvum]|uniref:CUE domain-containing protein n=1 Tax=Prymnesium parvum TaxID=97485 RepID=A0AB34J290_PRYPA